MPEQSFKKKFVMPGSYLADKYEKVKIRKNY
jgi:hypothetical protein